MTNVTPLFDTNTTDGRNNGGSRGDPTKLGSNVISRTKNYSYVKVVVTNKLVEIYTPETPYLLNRTPIKTGYSGKTEEKEDRIEEYKRRTANKAFNTVKRLAVANFGDITHAKFITATFANTTEFDISNIKECNERLTSFMRKLKSKYKGIKTLTIVEYQKRGAVHYHILSDVEYIHWFELQGMWKHGDITIEAVKDAGHLGTYLTKYFTKNVNDPRLKGFRLYHGSKNLTRPKTFYLDTADKIKWFLETHNINPRFESSYDSNNNGKIGFKEYLLDFPCSKIYE